VAKAWRTKVSAQTIANCFRKAGFIHKEVGVPDGDLDSGDVDDNLAEVNRHFDLLKSKTSWQGDLADYMTCDNSVIVHGQLSDDDIVAHVAGVEEDETDVIDEENLDPNCSTESVAQKKPTKAEIISAMEIINRSLEMTADSTDVMFNNLFDIEKHILTD
jgi:hypothetical protein